jgi:hypothetical protein
MSCNSETQPGPVTHKTQSPKTGNLETSARCDGGYESEKKKVPVLHALKGSRTNLCSEGYS